MTILISARNAKSFSSKQQTNNPDGLFIIAGDFNTCKLKDSFAKVLPTCELCNKGKQHTGLCLHNRKERLQSCTPPPPRALSPQNSSEFGQMMLPQHYRTAFSAQTGTCLKRQPPTTTTQTCRSTLKLWLLTSKSALMMWQSPRPSPHVQPEAVDDSRGSWAAKDQWWSIQIRR